MMQNSQVTQTVMDRTGGSLSRSKLAKFLSLAIIFFASTQLGLHFWPSSALVYGIRIDYLSPTLYFIDLLILLYLGFATNWDWRSVLKRNSWLQAKLGSAAAERTDPNGTLIGIIPVLLLNLLYSQNPFATLSWSLHLLLYLTCIISVPKIYLLKSISSILPLTLLFQSLLASAQVLLGHSVGGLMYYLGERSVAVGPPGIALGTFMDNVVLRAYGTFGHPNVLAGWSVVVLLIILRLSPEFRSLRDSRRVIGTFATILIIFLTQSRAAGLALFGLIIPFHYIKKLKIRMIYFVIFLASIFYLLTSGTPPRSDLSSSQRLTLQGLSLSVIKSFPVFGTGAQASISTYPTVSPTTRLLQPDHNSFTLFLSWFGIFGLLAILYSLRHILASSLYLLAPLAPLLALDHYFLTSPQGLFILLLYLQVALNYVHVQNNRQ